MEVIIRSCEKTDIVAVKAIYQQASCYSGTLQLPFPSEEMWLKRFENPPENYYNLIAEIKGKVVSQIGLLVYSSPRRKHVANIGMAVSENFQGQGIGAKLLSAALNLANNWLAVHRVELEVYTDNTAAIALYKKHGFCIEGTAKAYAFRNGHYVDSHLMAKVCRDKL